MQGNIAVPGAAELAPVAPVAPVAPSDRVAALDVIRGWALFGVLVANVYEVASGRRYGLAPPDASVADMTATRFIEIAISAKSITLLTMLFGLGFSIQLTRAGQRGEDVRHRFLRRLAALLAIGICHATLLWWIDVTWTYAVVGVLLLAFRRASDRALLAWAVAMIFIPRLTMAIPAIAAPVRDAFPHPDSLAAFHAQMVDAILGHDLPARMIMHARQILYHTPPIAAWYLPWMLGRFLLGFYAGRRQLFADGGAAHLPLFRRLLLGGLACGVAGTPAILLRAAGWFTPGALPVPVVVALTALHELAWLGLVIAYASGIVLLLQRPTARRALLVLAPLGRMPLTTYLSQSVVITFLFYGWGLGLTGQLGTAACLGLCVAVFAAQIAIARLWLARFRFGPAEWLWRTFTYGRLQPMRR